MGESVSLNYTVALILSAIALLALGGCVYKIYKPNCDPQALDSYTKFIDLFEKCSLTESACGEFDYSKISDSHKITLESKGEVTKVSLNCGGNIGKSKTFDRVGICKISDGIYFKLEGYEITNDMERDVKLVQRDKEVCFDIISGFSSGGVSDRYKRYE